MQKTNTQSQQARERFEKESKALKKNLAKRKQQEKELNSAKESASVKQNQ